MYIWHYLLMPDAKTSMYDPKTIAELQKYVDDGIKMLINNNQDFFDLTQAQLRLIDQRIENLEKNQVSLENRVNVILQKTHHSNQKQ